VPIELYLGRPSTANDLPYEALVTNADGAALTPVLSFGTYHILVGSRGHEEAEFGLDVPHIKTHATNGKFELSLTPLDPAVDDESDCTTCFVDGAKALQLELQGFRGVVMDSSGAVIPKVQIDVFTAEDPKQRVIRLKSDDTGQFSAGLALGEYLVTFEKLGFVHQRLLASIGSGGWRAMELTLALSNGCGNAAPGYESKVEGLDSWGH
jgi:hypothetical protein